MEPNDPPPTASAPQITTCSGPDGFSPGIGRYFAQLTEIRDGLLAQVADLTPEQLAWHPNPDTESVGTQLLHVAAVEWSWIFQDILGRPDDDYLRWEEAFPIRVGTPQVSGQPLSYYADRLARVRAAVRAVLRGMTDDDLSRLVGNAPPEPGEEGASRLYAIDWILFHLVHHEAHHAGQVELLTRLMPDAADLVGITTPAVMPEARR